WSSVSGSRTRVSIDSRRRSIDAQQRAVAAEAGTERRQPPPAAGRVVGERGDQNEVDEGARQVAVLAQHRSAVAERVAVELEAALEREQHIAAAGVDDPGSDVVAVQLRAVEH